ncbi:MAG: hypothetical protein JRI47_04010, partial [Deltaproteobacteria bacterium]|nr:hypothetical protein [Deltaproteobacteria bacterium]
NIALSLWSYRLVRFFLGVVFVYAGLVKLSDPAAFADLISVYEIVPESLLPLVAFGLPAVEVIAGLGLTFDVRGSLSTILSMLAIFVFVLWFGILKNLDIDCGCFSVEELAEHGALRGALYQDLWMIASALYLYGWRWGTGSIPQGGTRLKEAAINFIKGGNERMVNRKAALVWLVCVSLTLAMAESGFCFFGKKELETEKISVNLVREVDRGDYEIVTTEELKGWMDQNKDMVIVDTMPYEASYKKNHIPGAVQFLFPIPEMTEWDAKETDGKTQEQFIELLGPDKNKAVVIYCGFVKCTRSHNGAMWAKKLGYKNVYRYAGGIKGWLEADYRVGKVK